MSNKYLDVVSSADNSNPVFVVKNEEVGRNVNFDENQAERLYRELDHSLKTLGIIPHESGDSNPDISENIGNGTGKSHDLEPVGYRFKLESGFEYVAESKRHTKSIEARREPCFVAEDIIQLIEERIQEYKDNYSHEVRPDIKIDTLRELKFEFEDKRSKTDG